MDGFYGQPRPPRVFPLLEVYGMGYYTMADARGLAGLIDDGAFPALRAFVNSSRTDRNLTTIGGSISTKMTSEQQDRFTGFAQLLTEGQGFPTLKELCLDRGYAVGFDNAEEVNNILSALGPGTPSLESLSLRCTVLPSLHLGEGCRLAPGSLPRLRELIVTTPLDPGIVSAASFSPPGLCSRSCTSSRLCV